MIFKSKTVVAASVIVAIAVSSGLLLTKTSPAPVESTLEKVVLEEVRENTTDPVLKFKVTEKVVTASNGGFLMGEVNDLTVDLAITQLELAKSIGNSRLTLVLDSPGGSVFAGIRLINYIRFSKTPVDTVCVGICASMAAHIHQVGSKRFMTPDSVLMFHPASGGVSGTLEGMTNQLTAVKRIVDGLDASIARRVKIDFKVFKARVADELWIETSNALLEGFVDEIVNISMPSISALVPPAFTPTEQTNTRYNFRM